MKLFIALHIFLLSLSVSCAEHLPPIKPPKNHDGPNRKREVESDAKHTTKTKQHLPKIKKIPRRALKSRISPDDGVREYLIRIEGRAYWLDKKTIEQLAALEAVKKTWRKANKLGLSYDDYVLLREHGLLREQQKKQRKNCLV